MWIGLVWLTTNTVGPCKGSDELAGLKKGQQFLEKLSNY
jgi:hypothetical protein